MDLQVVTRWFVTVNDVEEEVSSVSELVVRIDRAESLESGEMRVSYDNGPRPFWHRLLGANRYISGLFVISWNGNSARLIFLDENFSEYRALASSATGSGGADDAGSENLKRSEAFGALREYLKSGNRPAWLTYRFVE